MIFGNMENISYLCNKKFMFTLYHIPDRKEWGCTKNLKGRLKKLGYTLDDVYETLKVEDKDKAADLERELNIMYGYGWNPSKDYRRVTKMGLVGGRIGALKRKGGKCYTPLKPVLVYNAKTNAYVGEYKSQKEASIELKISTGNITEVCKGNRKTAGGFVFKYKLIL